MPAIVALVILAVVLWLAGSRGETSSAIQPPTATKTYAQFEDELREFELNDAKIRMYRDVIYVYPSGRDPYLVQDISPEYTNGLLRKFMKTPNQPLQLDGIPQERMEPGAMAYGLLMVVAVLPYLFLGWLTVMLVRAANGAAEIDPEAGLEESRCPECSKPVPRDSRFCLHCAHPIQWAGGGRQCPGCGQQTWKNDRFCRSCGKSLPAPEVKRSAEVGAVTQAPRPPAARPAAPEAAPAPARAAAESPDASPAPKSEPESAPVRPPARPATSTRATGAARASDPGRAATRASDPGRPAARPDAAAPAKPPAPELTRSPLRPNRPPTPGPLPGEKP